MPERYGGAQGLWRRPHGVAGGGVNAEGVWLRNALGVEGGEVEVISREEAERVAASWDLATLARVAYREAFPNPAVDINGQAVLDLTTGEVRPSAYAEGHADVPGFAHLLTLVECEAKRKGRLSEKEFVRLVQNARRPGAEEIAKRLEDIYDGSRRLPPAV